MDMTEGCVNQLMTDEELELTQRIQRLYPRGMIASKELKEWRDAPDALVAKLLTAMLYQGPHEGPLIGALECILAAPFTPSRFQADLAYVLNEKDPARPQIRYMSEEFQKYFLGKVEGWTVSTLYGYPLTRTARNAEAFKELGPIERVKTRLACLYSSLVAQKTGEEKGVLTQGPWRNVFCIDDALGIPRVVFVQWLLGWNLSASPMEDLRSLHANDRIFSSSLCIVPRA